MVGADESTTAANETPVVGAVTDARLCETGSIDTMAIAPAANNPVITASGSRLLERAVAATATGGSSMGTNRSYNSSKRCRSVDVLRCMMVTVDSTWSSP